MGQKSMRGLLRLRDREPQALSTLILLFVGVLTAICLASAWWAKRRGRVLLVDFHAFQPPDENKVTPEYFMMHSRRIGKFDEEALVFQERLLLRTGLGRETYFPSGVLANPPDTSLQAARDEAELVLFGAFQGVLDSTGFVPEDIDILIVNCSLFNPTPSLSSMVVNKFKLKPSTRTYNLSGMGCSAGIIAIDLARDLLHTHPGVRCVVLSTENITQNWYLGNERSMLVTNTLFRMGSSAVLLSNRWRDKWRAKYRLLTTVRVHTGADDKAYKSIYQEQDETGRTGVSLSKHLLSVVGSALKSNMTCLGPQVLPYSEQIRFFAQLCLRRVLGKERVPMYVPDFKKAFEHFCIHAGGRAIIDGMQENLSLSDYQCEPSRATLFRFGNTSSSSIWYELNFIERDGRVRKGDRIWQIALGSGTKCNSAVWVALKSLPGVKKDKST